MSGKSVDQQHSATAMTAAGFRAVAQREYPASAFGADDLACHFLSPFERFLIRFQAIRRLGIKRHDRFTPGGFAYVLARTAFFDQVLVDAVNSGSQQIVLLGAGYDSRAFRFRDRCANCKLIELDIETTQSRKRHCLRKAGITIPENLIFASINFSSDSLCDTLLSAGYDPTEKTLFLWEGVSMYLPEEAVTAMLQFVSNCQHQESRIAFDYIISIAPEDMHKHYGVEAWQETWRRFRQNEPFLFALEEGRLSSLLHDNGLRLQQSWNSTEIESEFLPATGEQALGKVAGWFRLATASPS